MSNQAKVTSVEALGAFRSSLIVFLSRAGQSLDEVGDQVRRARQWVQNDQRTHWEGEIRRRRKLLDLAQQELFSARLSGLKDSTTMQEVAVRKAKQAMAEAEEKLANVKRWSRDFDHQLGPLAKKLEGLRGYLDAEMPKALVYLVQAQRTLDAYSETAPPPRDAAAGAAEAPPPP